MSDLEEVDRSELPSDKTQQLIECFKSGSRLRNELESIPDKLRLKDETELEKMFKPTPMDYAMKKQIWSKFYECEETGIYALKATDVYSGVCTNAYFYNELMKNQVRITWLFSPPINYSALIEEAFRVAFHKVRDGILNMPVTEKSAGVILKTFQLLADRHLGPIVQRVESKNLNVEVQGGKVDTPTDPREIENRLNELKQKLLKPAQPVKDVTPE